MAQSQSRWQTYLEERIRFLVLRDFFKKQLYKRLPPHTGLLHVFGSLALLLFINQFVTGILLLLWLARRRLVDAGGKLREREGTPRVG